MLKTDHLHQLILNLNPTEKRYFKVTCQGHNDKPNNYILLFNAIEQMKEYDEDFLLKKFKGTKFIKHLPSEKNYLYDLILKTMRSYNASRTKANELHSYVQDVQFLFDKGLYEVCFKRIKKAKKIAYDFDRYGELLDLIHWHRKLLKYISKSDFIQQTKELKAERNDVINIIQNENDIINLYDGIFLLVIENSGNDIGAQEIEKLLSHKLLHSVDQSISFKAKTFYFLSLAFRSLLLKDMVSCSNYHRQGMLLWESRPDRIIEEPDRYKSTLQNYASYAMVHTRNNDIIDAIQKLKDLPSITSKEAAYDFQRVYSMELYFYMNEADFTSASTIIKENESKLNEFEGLIDRAGILALYYNIASILFLKHDFDKCIKLLQKIHNVKADVREDIRHFAMIMELIIHYETTPGIVESFYRSTHRQLTKNGTPNEFETTLLKYLKKMINILGTDKEEVTRLLKKLQMELVALETKEKFIGMEEISCWIESKLRRMPMNEILKEKVKLHRASLA